MTSKTRKSGKYQVVIRSRKSKNKQYNGQN